MVRGKIGNLVNADIVIKSDSLNDLLSKIKEILLKKGIKTKSQRGLTWSLNRVLLVWSNPEKDTKRFSNWSEKDDNWYQTVFVAKGKKNKPERLAIRGDLIFPYTYAQRSRFYDSGWGCGLGTINAIKTIDSNVDRVLRSYKNFENWLIQISEQIHLQTVLAVLFWWKRNLLTLFFKNSHLVEKILKKTRIDTLSIICNEINKFPLSRRAITPSFMYPADYLLKSMMGVPPYQNFQLLPANNNEVLSSLHWHRSLDATGGAQLDFSHDFNWLSYASKKCGRKMGSIAIFVGNLHLYRDLGEKEMVTNNTNIKDWLKRVTDGYEAGLGIPQDLIKNETYQVNARRVYSILTRK